MNTATPQLERPPQQRTQVIAKDVLTGKSRSITVYGATPSTVIETLEAAIEKGFPSPEGQSSSSAASPGSTGDVEGATNNAKQVA